jgi:SAM-dependent MidA family methyltransferase
VVRWREAMAAALYGPRGFFTRPGASPAAHFRTSAHTSPLFAAAILRLTEEVDAALGRPDPLDLVDVGAGGGELLSAVVAAAAGSPLAPRLRPVAVEVTPRPDGPARVDAETCDDPRALAVTWRGSVPEAVTGLLVATEWLDNVPLDVAEVDPDGVVRYVLVDPATGAESLGEPVAGRDLDWLARWWPLHEPGTRAEIGRPRDRAWADAVARVRRGAALAVDYGHLAGRRPLLGTLTGFRHGREVPPVPDGSCDLTAHVALDAVARAGAPPGAGAQGAAPPGHHAVLVTQAEALRALGVDGTRPPLVLAYQDPAAYLRRLADASAAAELTDPTGLGGHHWLLHPVALPHPIRPFVARWPA